MLIGVQTRYTIGTMDDNEKPQQGLEPKPAQTVVRAKANGLAQTKSMTEKYEEVMESDLDRILRKIKAAWISGLDSDNVKIRVDTAHKLSGHLYKPDSKVTVKHEGEVSSGPTFNIVNIDALTHEEKALLARVQKHMPLDVVSEVIEGEVIEEE